MHLHVDDYALVDWKGRIYFSCPCLHAADDIDSLFQSHVEQPTESSLRVVSSAAYHCKRNASRTGLVTTSSLNQLFDIVYMRLEIFPWCVDGAGNVANVELLSRSDV